MSQAEEISKIYDQVKVDRLERRNLIAWLSPLAGGMTLTLMEASEGRWEKGEERDVEDL